MKIEILVALAVAALFGSVSCAAQSREPNYGALAKVPEKARTRSNPLVSDPGAIAAGAKLFEQHCAECHGETGEGGKRGPSLQREQVRQAAPGTLFWILTNGVVRRGMPVWSKLPEPQRWQIITYLQSHGIK